MTSPLSSPKPNKPKLVRPVRLQLRRIMGDSMLPTLRQGQLVLFASGHPAKVGDIVMIRHNGVEKIKRVARLEGGRVYLLGDNPEASTDSRQFGWLGVEVIRGVLLWPRSRRAVLQ